MKDPNDTRNIGPRIGSPLWFYLNTVTAAGLVLLILSVLRLDGLAVLVRHPLFWLLAILITIGEMRPIVTPGKSGNEAPVASLTFSFAALLFWGFAVAVLLRAAVVLGVGLAQRKALHRSAFNAAQVTLAMGAAGLTLGWAGIHPSPSAPWTLVGAQLPMAALAALAYFAVNFFLVGVAIAVHTRTAIVRTLRAALPYQAFVNLVLLSAAPLVAVVMGARSAALLLLFAFPLAAIYANAVISAQREHQAHHDELTGLSNRKLLTRRTAEALASADIQGLRAGFLLLDLDRFKEVNDTLGHAVGDQLLRIIAHRLTHSVRPCDLVARLGGDEFAVLLPSVRDAAVAREVASRLRAALAEPIRLECMSFSIEASIGIAIYPDDAIGFEVLMQRADVAMYLAKERRSGVERYVADSDRNSPARLALLGDLRRGLDAGELELHFQPKIELDTGHACGMEALVRWHHPERGLMMPGQFIPLAEQSYLMRDLTSQVVDQALAQASAWWQNGRTIQVSLNISARDLLDAGLAEIIGAGLSRHRLPPHALLLEINERVLTSEPAHAIAAVEKLAALGVALSLDDFGTGYSSLVRLRRLPVHEVKIDSSFVGRMLVSGDDKIIVQSIVDMVRTLGISSVAEGVETAETAAALRGMGCQTGQGWYFSAPLNAASASAWLAEHRISEHRISEFGAGDHRPSEHGASDHRANGSRAARRPAKPVRGLPAPGGVAAGLPGGAAGMPDGAAGMRGGAAGMPGGAAPAPVVPPPAAAPPAVPSPAASVPRPADWASGSSSR